MKGDIISFETKSSASVTHRVYEIQNNNNTLTFITKGDANNIPDIDPVSVEQIKGKVIFIIPYIGYLYLWIKQPIGFLLLIITPALYIIVSEIIVAKKLIEREAIKKYNKQHPVTPHLIIIGLLSIALSFLSAKKTISYFSSGLVLSGNIFSTGKWSTDDPPAADDPTAILTISSDGHTATFTVTNTSSFDQISYTLTYDTDTKTQGLMGTIAINGNNIITKDGLTLGTCSTGGTCTYDTGVNNVTLSVALTNSKGETKNLTAHP